MTEKGLMQPAGLAIFEKCRPEKSKVYAYEQKNITLNQVYETQLKANPKAWAYFEKLASGYKRQTIWWVMSAKRQATQLKRLKIMIDYCEAGLKIPPMRRKK